jgi:ABC-type antimicrobial peptide transport system permease subunit
MVCALGLYAVVACATVRRTREIGVRSALGASRGQVVRLVFGRGSHLIFNGLVLGGFAAYSLSHVLGSLLYGVQPGDPVILGAVALLLGGAMLLAGYLPARRAARAERVRDSANRCEVRSLDPRGRREGLAIRRRPR